jgi:hypothetical protein
MKKIGLGRPNPDLRKFMESLIASAQMESMEVLKPEAEAVSTLGAIIISTALNVPKSNLAAESMSINHEWREVVYRFRQVDPNIPVILVTGGFIPLAMMQAMLRVRLGIEVELLEVDDSIRDDDRLGKPLTMVVIKESDVNPDKSGFNQDLLVAILTSHSRAA